MKGLYIAYSIILIIDVIVFSQRLVYWACKCREGKALLKDMRPSNERYATIYGRFRTAKTRAICWLIISFTAFFAYLDCVAQIFRG